MAYIEGKTARASQGDSIQSANSLEPVLTGRKRMVDAISSVDGNYHDLTNSPHHPKASAAHGGSQSTLKNPFEELSVSGTLGLRSFESSVVGVSFKPRSPEGCLPGQPLAEFGFRPAVSCCCISLNGRSIAASTGDERVVVWYATTGVVRHRLDVSIQPTMLQWSPDGRFLAAVQSNLGSGTAHLWEDKGSFSPVARPVADFSSFSWLPGGHKAGIIVPKGLSVRTVDMTVDSLPRIVCSRDDVIDCFAWNPSGRSIALASGDTVVVLDSCNREVFAQPIQPPSTPGSSVEPSWHVSWSSDGTMLYCWRFSLVVWHCGTGKLQMVHNASRLRRRVQCAAWSPDGRYIATGSKRSSIRVWNVAKGGEELSIVCPLSTNKTGITDISWAPNGQFLIAAERSVCIRMQLAT